MIFIKKPEPRERATVSAMPIIAASDNEVVTEGRYILLWRSFWKSVYNYKRNKILTT